MANRVNRTENLTSWRSDWAGLRVAVIGLGKTGFSAADTLQELGSEVLVLARSAENDLLEILDALSVPYLVKDSDDELSSALIDFDPELAIVSPGIRPDSKLVMQLGDAGIECWTDVDLAWRLRDKFIADQEWICITGTNGKTTTTELTEAMLLAAGVRAVACGNIGKPILDAIRDPAQFEVLVVELSSFQLHYLSEISPYSSAVLNIAEDHLDWHGGMENYTAAKGKIYQNTKIACIYNLEDEVTRELVERADVVEGARAIGFTLGTPAPSNVGYVEDLLVDRAFLEERKDSALEVASLSELANLGVLTGHLLANIAAATALARSFGAPPAACRKALLEFRLSPHRIELVQELAGVRYIDDSKATNAHAAAASLASFESIVWILGGLLKGQNLDPLIAKFHSRLRGAVVIGRDRGEIVSAFGTLAPKVPIREVQDSEAVMSEAVAIAQSMARSGDVVLLAPAAASMDQFKDYEDRGNQFAHAVAELRGDTK